MNGAASPQVGEATPARGRPLTLVLPGHSTRGARVSSGPVVAVHEEFEHVLDPAVQKVLRDFGGVNARGHLNYRIVWGYQRGHWFGGQYYLKYIDNARHRERWHLEKWVPAESFGTPEQWYKAAMADIDGLRVNVLGPYPIEGEYVRVVIFENYFTGEFVRPAPDMVMEAIVRNRQHAELTRRQIREKILADMKAERKLTSDRQDEEIAKREAAFAFTRWMPVSGPMTPEYRRRETWEPPRA